MNKSVEVDRYISNFSGEQKIRLEKMRELVSALAPQAVESISYGLIGYKFADKPLVYFGGFPRHTGFYATPNGHEAFAKSLQDISKAKVRYSFHSISRCRSNSLLALLSIAWNMQSMRKRYKI